MCEYIVGIVRRSIPEKRRLGPILPQHGFLARSNMRCSLDSSDGRIGRSSLRLPLRVQSSVLRRHIAHANVPRLLFSNAQRVPTYLGIENRVVDPFLKVHLEHRFYDVPQARSTLRGSLSLVDVRRVDDPVVRHLPRAEHGRAEHDRALSTVSHNLSERRCEPLYKHARCCLVDVLHPFHYGLRRND